MNFTLDNMLPVFPAGTVLSVYSSSIVDGGEVRPIGLLVASAGTVAEDGTAELTGLPEGHERLVAAAKVNGAWQTRAFAIGSQSAGTGPATKGELARKANLKDGKLAESEIPLSVVSVSAEATRGQAVTWDGSAYAPATPAIFRAREFGPEGSPAFQEAVEAAEDVGGVVTLDREDDYTIDTSVVIKKRIGIDLAGSKLRSAADPNTEPMFKSDDEHGMDLVLSRGYIATDNRVLQATLKGGVGVGQTARISDLWIVGAGDEARAADHFYFKQMDFLVMQRVQAYKANRCIVFDSDFTQGERDNTQLHLTSVTAIESNLGLYARGTDKMVLRGMDIAHCSSGFRLVRNNKRSKLIGCHAESFGSSGYTYVEKPGCAFSIGNTEADQQGITLESCSAMLPGTEAISGFDLDSEPSAFPSSPVVFRECYAEPKAGSIATYSALRLRGSCVWEGEFSRLYTDKDFSLGSSLADGGQWGCVQVRENGQVASASKNLLPFSRISRPEDLGSNVNTPTFTVEAEETKIPGGRKLSLTGATGEKLRYTTVVLKAGWHTLLLQGYAEVADLAVFVMTNGSSTEMLKRKRFKGSTSGQTYVLPFYVPEANVGTMRVGFLISTGGGVAVLSRIELHQGLVTQFSDDPSVSRATEVPAAGAYNVGDIVWKSNPASGSPAGWVCTTAGSTFKAMGNLS